MPSPNPASPPEVHHITWEALPTLTEAVYQSLHTGRSKPLPFAACLAISRGGLIPAAMLWRRMGQYHPMYTAAAQSYKDKTRVLPTGQPPKIFLPPNLERYYRGCHILIVDDILDTGETYRAIASHLNSLRITYEFVSLVTKAEPHTQPFGCHFGLMVGPKKWVTFPWEDWDPVELPEVVTEELLPPPIWEDSGHKYYPQMRRAWVAFQQLSLVPFEGAAGRWDLEMCKLLDAGHSERDACSKVLVKCFDWSYHRTDPLDSFSQR